METIWQQAEGLSKEMIARRRDLHQHPETGWETITLCVEGGRDGTISKPG